MSKEQINLSDALDLIAQSKADIKDSVEGKGGIIGDDLTEYNTAIDNIKFRSLMMENNVSLFRYADATTFNVQQYLDGVTSFPENLDYSVVGDNVTVSMTEESDGATSQRFMLTPTGYGNTTLTIEDKIGNCEYPVTIGVGPITVLLDPAWEDNSGFLSFGYNDDESSENYGNAEAEWDTTAQSWFLDLTLIDAEGHPIPVSAMTQFSYDGDLEDYMTITTSAVQGYANIIRLNITPTACYNGHINIHLGDGTCDGDLHIIFIGGEDISQESGFTYDGSDSSAPIQVNIDLADYPADTIINTFHEVNINFAGPSPDYMYTEKDTWTCNASVDELYSDDNDCMLCADMMQQMGEWTLGNGGYGYTGPSSVGTYLKSYTLTFHYDSDKSMKTDENTGEPVDDPVAQALDGTDVTFYVEYNVTDSGAGE